MINRPVQIGIFSLALAAGAWTLAQPAGQSAPKPANAAEESDEETIELSKAPEAVRAAALKLVGSAGEKSIKKVIKEEDDDIATYEIEFTADGVDCSAVLSQAGDLMETEKSVNVSTLPRAAMDAIKKEFPSAAVAGINHVQKFYYEVEVTIGGKRREIKVDASGEIEDHDEAKHADKEHGEHKEGKHNGAKDND